MQIFPLQEGSYSVDASKKFIPFDPNFHKSSERPGSLFIHVQPFLVKTESDLILFDAGLGFKNNQDELILHQNIRNAGFEPEEVSLVLMSHLHYDHTGGLVIERNGKLEPSFPDAEHIVQRGEWETAFSGKSSSYRLPIFETLQRSANFTLLEGDGEFKQGITYQLSGGHCQFHQVFLLSENNEKIFFGGDELPEPEQLLRKFVAKYDYDGRKAMNLREEYGKKAADEGWTCLFYHSKTNTVAQVKYENESFSIIPA
ncbi:MBL fold metallo-hydrolase [Mucilaginibacter paludis]|uniref:Beta-lactamase domain protein n=1 Tax=Mucilaginibacter paludis DSM 18603 TaxID=714943 RepID=H1YHA7_9SPHI|nr:MBL fold metallo-hydrolase [Mucilaginibacter paludis]EHQ25441.1 beta-lactamase domain protein [Mucilaginibacter paludis DSM 18603]